MPVRGMQGWGWGALSRPEGVGEREEKICQLSRSVNTCIRNAADIAVVCISSTSIIIFNKVAALWTPQASAHHNYKFHRRSFSRRKKHVGHRCWLSCSGRQGSNLKVGSKHEPLTAFRKKQETDKRTDRQTSRFL